MPPSRDVLAQAATVMLGPAGLTARSPVFDRRDVVRAWCGQLPGGAPVDYVERLADTLLDKPDVIPVDRADRATLRPGAARSLARHTTTDMLATEVAVLHAAIASRDTGRAVVAENDVDQVLAAHPLLSAEQAAMVRQLTTSGHGVEVVVGKAGTGKTHALAAAYEAWATAGHRVIGTAVAARAAVALTEEAGIPAVSVTRLLAATERARARGLAGVIPAGGVLVVDEAGMLGTRQLARLLEATRDAGAKLVLVGDHRQLPELAAGGTFRALARELSAVRLTENHRQEHAWERDALDDLRHGDVDRALDTYERHGRITFTQDGSRQRDALVSAWWDAVRDDAGGRDRRVPPEPIMLAARRVDVEDLNRQARDRMARAGHLHGPALHVEVTERGHRDYQVGDVVIARRNAYLDGLVNGQRGVVTHVDIDAGTLTIGVGARRIIVPSTYLRSGAIEYGYALTVHQAQGLTTNRTFLLGDSALYREIGYVGLSRARQHAELHLTNRPDQLNDDQESCTTAREGSPRRRS